MGGRGAKSSKVTGARSLSNTEQNAIFEYTTSRYQQINGNLRDGKKISKNDQKIIESLDSAANKSTIPKGTELYRGTTAEALGIHKDIQNMTANDVKQLIGQTIQDKAYTSTSRNKESAKNFAGRGSKVNGNVNLVITTKSNTKGIDVKNNSNFGGKEQEVILPRNAKLTITGAKRKLGNLTVYAEY